MEKIKLNSRYGDENYLVKDSDKAYHLEAKLSYRIGRTPEGKNFIDPSGGPYMEEGSFVDEVGMEIEVIEGHKIIFK